MGSFRPLPLAEHLLGFNWKSIVLTAPLAEKPEVPFQIIETPYNDNSDFWKRLLGLNPNMGIGKQVKTKLGITRKKSLIDLFLAFGEEILLYPDAAKDWKSVAIKTTEELLQTEKIDAMISCHPFTSHLIASKLKTKYNIPWLADFPDLWSQNHDYSFSPLRRIFERRLELRTLSTADALVTVSEPWAEKLRALHNRKTVYAITHGFSPDEVNIPPADLTAKFTITYTGTVFGKQDPAKLFAALKDLTSDGIINTEDVEVRFYGTDVVWLDEEIKRYGLSNVVKYYERVPEEVSLEKQRESQLLLLMDWDDPEEPGLYLGKIFEYLGARRPVLATGGFEGDVIDELLIKTKAGVHATNVSDIKEVLTRLYQEYKQNGKVVYNGIESEINKYSHREMARKFAEVLDRVASNHGQIIAK